MVIEEMTPKRTREVPKGASLRPAHKVFRIMQAPTAYGAMLLIDAPEAPTTK